MDADLRRKVAESLLESYKWAEANHQILNFKMQRTHDLFCILFYYRIINIAGAILTLELSDPPSPSIDNRAMTPILFRSALEASIDLSNLLDDPDYGLHLEAAFSHEWKRLLSEATSGNKYLAALGELEGVEDMLAAYQAKLDELKEKGVLPLRALERFDLAGIEDKYRSVYPYLCAQSHNNLQALSSAHIEETGHSKRVMLHNKSHAGGSDLMDLLDCLNTASSRMHEEWGTKKTKASVAALVARVDDIAANAAKDL